MSTIRESLENSFAATAFAERGLQSEAKLLLQGQRATTAVRATSVQAEKRPRPTLQAK